MLDRGLHRQIQRQLQRGSRLCRVAQARVQRAQAQFHGAGFDAAVTVQPDGGGVGRRGVGLAAQRRQLDALGVKYGMRLDGSLVVLESAVEAAFGAPTATKSKKREFVINASP